MGDNAKEDFLKKLGLRIAELRADLKLTQNELGLRCDKDKQNINRLEKGKINPSIYYLKQISEALEVSLGELLDFNKKQE